MVMVMVMAVAAVAVITVPYCSKVVNSTGSENEPSSGCDLSGCNGIIAMSAFTAQELARVIRGK